MEMRVLGLRNVLLFVLLYFTCNVKALKCRASQEVQQNNDFEYVVRMCFRRLRNDSGFNENMYRSQNENEYSNNRNKKHRDGMSNNNNNHDNGNNYYGNSNSNNFNNNNDHRNFHRNQNDERPNGFDRFWISNDRNKDWNDDRMRPDEDYNGDSDYYMPSRNGKDGRKTYKSRPQPPHSYQQQVQYDRDMMYSHNNRDYNNHFYGNRNKNSKQMFTKDKANESPLSDIEPCIIHCIFQEMQMVDDNGKPNKNLISQKMTQKIRNPELKNFIQDSVEECFDNLEDEGFSNYGSGNNNNNNNNGNNRHKNQDSMCDWAKTFAMCLEDRGRENCDDWNEPVSKNSNNNGNNNNNNNNKNSEEQKHKSKQNERG